MSQQNNFATLKRQQQSGFRLFGTRTGGCGGTKRNSTAEIDTEDSSEEEEDEHIKIVLDPKHHFEA